MAKRTVTLHDKYKSTTALYPKIDASSFTPSATEYVKEISSGDKVQSNWNENDNTSPAYIKNKPTIPEAQVQADWNETNTNSKAYIKNKPSIVGQVQSNWNESDNTSPAYIQNKPSIPSAQVQSNWNETNTDSPAYIQNKPNIPDIVVANPTLSGTETDLTGIQIGSTKYKIPSSSSNHLYLHHFNIIQLADMSVKFSIFSSSSTAITTISALTTLLINKGATVAYNSGIEPTGFLKDPDTSSAGKLPKNVYINSNNKLVISYFTAGGGSEGSIIPENMTDISVYDFVETII